MENGHGGKRSGAGRPRKPLVDKLLEGKLFVGMPSKESKTGYRNTVHVDKEFREDFSAAVLAAHYDAVEREMERAEKMRSGPDKPPRMAEQMKTVEKEAAAHNAALPPKDKGVKSRDGRE